MHRNLYQLREIEAQSNNVFFLLQECLVAEKEGKKEEQDEGWQTGKGGREGGSLESIMTLTKVACR